MRILTISNGNSCTAKTWNNEELTYEDLCERLRFTNRTPETIEEYRRMAKSDRDKVKDKGGFVGGKLKDGKRRREMVEYRSMLTLDIDQADKDFLKQFQEQSQYAFILYSTHSHTAEQPRFRLIIPLLRNVNCEEFNAISRYTACSLGMEQFDVCSFRPAQLMYYPTTPKDGEYVFVSKDGPWMDPDEVLASHPDWKDVSHLPTLKQETVLPVCDGRKLEDPLTKDGVVGVFCRTFTIREAIERFLSDVYSPSVTVAGRYDYIPAESTGGLWVIENKFAHSFHASDPACDRTLNAFDLVRVHLYDTEDEQAGYRAMCDFAMALEEVKMQLAEEREQQFQEDFRTDAPDWRVNLRYLPRSSVLENCVYNEVLILKNDPDFANIRYNKMASRIQVVGPVPWERPRENSFWRDADTAQLKAWMDVKYVPFSNRNHEVSFLKVVDDRSFHPIRDYLDQLPRWDGVKRLETLLIRCLKADDTEYVRTVTRKTFAAAVARIYEPGTKFDSVLVLDGEQGIGKSSLFKDLVGVDYYSDTLSLTDMNDKSGAEKLQGFWIVEIAELAGMKKADIERVKAFLSTADDQYRPSYGRTVESHPRQCIIVASVNGERGYLRDITGNRRFWVVKVHQKEQIKNWSFTPEERDQIWAEAKALWNAGEKLYLEGNLIQQAETAQHSAMEEDERKGVVEEYLQKLLPKQWLDMDLYQRRAYLNGDGTVIGTEKRKTVCNMEIWCECFGKEPSALKSSESYAIAALMTQIPGWKKCPNPKKYGIYGRQRYYEFVEMLEESA